VDALMSPRAALELALDGERSGHAYYAAMAATTADAELRAIASEFASEEAEHVWSCELEKLLAACAA
jgi:rubrerythrin